MKSIADSRLFYILLLFTVCGEFFLPAVLARFYSGYDGKFMALSALGSPQSPVRFIYNAWLLWTGCFFTFTAWAYFEQTRTVFPVLSVLLLVSIGIFAIGAGILSGIFSVNESREVITTASQVHGVSAATGFIALLFFPLLDGIAAFRQKDIPAGILGILSFAFALVFFVCFVMGDHPPFQNTVLRYEGCWERLTLFCMYIPFVYRSLGRIRF